jgi:hypothetical protein
MDAVGADGLATTLLVDSVAAPEHAISPQAKLAQPHFTLCNRSPANVPALTCGRNGSGGDDDASTTQRAAGAERTRREGFRDGTKPARFSGLLGRRRQAGRGAIDLRDAGSATSRTTLQADSGNGAIDRKQMTERYDAQKRPV